MIISQFFVPVDDVLEVLMDPLLRVLHIAPIRETRLKAEEDPVEARFPAAQCCIIDRVDEVVRPIKAVFPEAVCRIGAEGPCQLEIEKAP